MSLLKRLLRLENAVTYGQEPEEYRTSDALGYGSTATKIPYYKATPDKDTINLLGTVANDSTNGWSFTANVRCKVYFSYSVGTNATQWIGISLNGTVTTDIQTNAEENVLTVGYQSTGGAGTTSSCAVILEAGDILRPHTMGAGTVNSGDAEHALTLLVEPIQGIRV